MPEHKMFFDKNSTKNGSINFFTLVLVLFEICLPTEAMSACSYEVKGAGAKYNSSGNDVILPYSPLSSEVSFDNGKGSLLIYIDTQCPWTVDAIPSWINLNLAPVREKNTISALIPENTSSSSRSGVITISGQSITVKQDAPHCTYQLSGRWAMYDGSEYSLVLPYTPLSKSNLLESGKAALSIGVATQPGCKWSITQSPSWVNFSEGAGTGNFVLNTSITPNTSKSMRTGTIALGGQTIVIRQAGRANDMTCKYILTTRMAFISREGGHLSVSLGMDSGCTLAPSDASWAATSNVPWAIVTTRNSGAENSIVGYTIAPNPTKSERRGTLVVAGEKIALIQRP